MLMAEQEVGNWQPCKSPTSWLPLHDLKCDTEPFDIPKSPEHHRFITGSPFESSDSESDSSSDSGDDASSMVSEDLSLSIHDLAFSSNECFLYCEDIEILAILESNALGLEFPSEADILDTREFLAARPQAGSLRAPHHHQDDHNYDISSQRHHVWQEHLAHQPKSQAEKTLASERPQDICLRANMRGTSGREAFQGLYSGRPEVNPCPRFSEPHTDDRAENLPSTGDPGQGAAADTFSTCVMNAQAHDFELQRAPRMRLISLPEVEEHRLYGGPDLGGWLPGTLGGIMTLDHLEFLLPVPFSTVN